MHGVNDTNDTKDMNFKKARDLLELPNNFSLKQLKKNYHTKALKTHPDKCKDDNAKEKFNEINEAYSYLLTYLSVVNQSEKHEVETYEQMLYNFLNTHNISLKDTISTIVSGYQKISVSMFEAFDKQTAMELYTFISRYKYLLYLHDENLESIKKIIREKVKNDNIYILNPSLSDLFNHRIYKLKCNDNTYYVPLWLSELHYENDIIVFCIPDLPDHITIDENNNIHCSIQTKISGLLKNEKITVDMCELDDSKERKIISISTSDLFIRKYQTITKVNEGISILNSDDCYNIEKLSTVYVHITLIE